MIRSTLIHYGIVMPSGIIDHCQHWFRGGVTKMLFINFSVKEISDFAKIPVRFFESFSYLMGVNRGNWISYHTPGIGVLYDWWHHAITWANTVFKWDLVAFNRVSFKKKCWTYELQKCVFTGYPLLSCSMQYHDMENYVSLWRLYKLEHRYRKSSVSYDCIPTIMENVDQQPLLGLHYHCKPTFSEVSATHLEVTDEI